MCMGHYSYISTEDSYMCIEHLLFKIAIGAGHLLSTEDTYMHGTFAIRYSYRYMRHLLSIEGSYMVHGAAFAIY